VAALPAQAQDRSLTIGLAANVNTLDPDMTGSVGTDLSVISHLYAPLVIRGPDMKLAPALAQQWSQVDDRTWRFTLVPGAHFADGEKMDAAAVKWNIDRVRDPKVNARIASWFEPVADVRVVSDTVLEIVTKAPYPALADQLSMFFLLPPTWTATHNPAHEAMAGGPYTLAEFVPGDHITLKANPGYFGPKPDFATVTFRIIPDAASRVAALLAGEIDLTTGLPVEEIKQVQSSGRATAGAVPSTRSLFIKFNTQIAPLKDNQALRQALNYAIDKKALSDGIFDGLAPVSPCEVLTPEYTGFNPALKPYPFDPARARDMVRQAGAEGTTLTMEVPANVYLQGEDVAQAVAAQIEDVGVHVKLQEMEFGAWMNKYLRAHDLGQMAYLTQAWPTLDADGLLTLFAPGNPYAYWDDVVFGKLLDQARTTTDPKVRDSLYAQATARMCDAAPVIFLLVQPATYGVGNRITWHPRGDDWVRAMDARPK
jgi:peptide/nickel transport system substrate-binding protein